jgi:steroid delta-isomerase-like uncharacterized protein
MGIFGRKKGTDPGKGNTNSSSSTPTPPPAVIRIVGDTNRAATRGIGGDGQQEQVTTTSNVSTDELRQLDPNPIPITPARPAPLPLVQDIPVGDPSLATAEVTRQLVKSFIAEIWNRGNIELISTLCSPSLRFNGHVGMDKVGHEGFARMVTTVRDALTDYHCEVHSMVVEKNKAFCRLKFTGKHTGTLLGYPPTGRAVQWVGAAEFTCKNGRILKVWELGDVKSLQNQLSSDARC